LVLSLTRPATRLLAGHIGLERAHDGAPNWGSWGDYLNEDLAEAEKTSGPPGSAQQPRQRQQGQQDHPDHHRAPHQAHDLRQVADLGLRPGVLSLSADSASASPAEKSGDCEGSA
jgi:hypothetical protein